MYFSISDVEITQRRVNDFLLFDCLRPFCFLLIEFYCSHPHKNVSQHLHILNGLSGTIDSKREWRIHTYSTNIWVFNPVYKYRFIDFQKY